MTNANGAQGLAAPGLASPAIGPSKPKIEVLDVKTDLYPDMQEGEYIGYVETVVIDTINELQNAEYLEMIDPNTGQQVTQKKYANLGINMKTLVDFCKNLRSAGNDNGQVVFILGNEGTGKSFGVKYLNPRTTCWIHCDSKPGTFRGTKNYKSDPYYNYLETKDYGVVKAKLKEMYERRNPYVPFIVFIMGHLEMVESKNSTEYKEQLKTVGAFAHKLNIEGAVSNCYMTGVHFDPLTNKQVFYMDTQNNGNNTVRCQEDLFPARYIPNNLEYIRNQIINW